MSRGHKRGDLSHALTDLMAGLAVVFLLLAAVFIVKAQQNAKSIIEKAQQNAKSIIEAPSEHAKKVVEKVSKAIRDRNGKESVTLSPSGTEAIIRFQLNFDPGKCKVDPEEGQALVVIIKDMLREICQDKSARLYLEGHTDFVPIESSNSSCGVIPLGSECKGQLQGNVPWTPACCSKVFESNVQLSSARAHDAFVFIRQALEKDTEALQCLDRLIVVAGRGPAEPLGERQTTQQCVPGLTERIDKADDER
jgi:flagellar motor protein MotB